MKLNNSQEKDQRFKFKTVEEKYSVFGRKERRKQERIDKKQKNQQKQQVSKVSSQQKNVQPEVKVQEIRKILQIKKKDVKEPKIVKKLKTESLIKKQIDQDDKEIADLEKKLKITSKSKKKKAFNETGFDDDLFDFLQDIHTNVKKDVKDYQYRERKISEQDDSEDSSESSLQQSTEEIQNSKIKKNKKVSFDEELDYDQDIYNELFQAQDGEEFEDEFEIDDALLQEESEDNTKKQDKKVTKKKDKKGTQNEEKKRIQNQEKKGTNNKEKKENTIQQIEQQNINQQTPEIKSRALQVYSDEETLQLQKKINACFNRLTENNIENMFNQINQIFQENPRSVSGELVAQIFIKSNIDAQNVPQFIIACNVAIISAIHQIYDNDFFHIIIEKLIDKIKTDEHINQENVSHIISLFYLFDDITLDFLISFIQHLIKIGLQTVLEQLLILFQNTGMKIRGDNPKILKDLIDQVVVSISQQKSSKEQYLLDTLQEIKMNKRVKGDPTERLVFLTNFLKKSIIQKLKIPTKIFTLDFQFCLSADFSKRNWWQPLDYQTQMSSKVEITMENKELSYLGIIIYKEQKAIEQKFTTDTRKRIFITIMSSLDFLDATQRLIKLQLNKNQLREIAIVITESCAQELKFNKFYCYLAQKLIEMDKQYKYSFQYCIWDHLKLLQNYTANKIFNISKIIQIFKLKGRFCSFLTNEGLMTFGLIKVLDLFSMNEQQEMFLKIFIKSILTENEAAKLKDLCQRVKQNEELMVFRQQLADFMKQKMIKTYKDSQVQSFIKEMLVKAKFLIKNLEVEM